jgi:hypothetical protein
VHIQQLGEMIFPPSQNCGRLQPGHPSRETNKKVKKKKKTLILFKDDIRTFPLKGVINS